MLCPCGTYYFSPKGLARNGNVALIPAAYISHNKAIFY